MADGDEAVSAGNSKPAAYRGLVAFAADGTVRAPAGEAGYLRLTYASIAATGFNGHREYPAIVDHARPANRLAGIGGVLAFDGHQFLQILEGPVEQVEALFARITADPRHYGVVCLRHTAVAVRYFDEWGMRRQPAIDILQLSERIR